MVCLSNRVVVAIVLGLACPIWCGCSSAEPDPPPHGPKDLRIGVSTIVDQTPISEGELAVDRCSLGLSADAPIPLLVWVTPYASYPNLTPALSKLGDFELQPPGQACSAGNNCGWFVIVASSDAFCTNKPCEPQQIPTIRSPLRFDLPLTLPSTELTLSVELRDLTNAPVLADDGKPLHADAAVNVVPSVCPSMP